MYRSRTNRFGRNSWPKNLAGGSNRRPSNAPKRDYINPERFIQAAKPRTEEAYIPLHHFSDFPVDDLIKRNIAAMKFDVPTPIQDQTIPLGLAGKDVVGIANTGTGKTAAFAIPLLHRLMTDPLAKALILAPTRELAQQIDEQCRAIAKGSGLKGALLIGGLSMIPQLKDLQANPRIIIGTPGRVKDHLQRRSLDISDCTLVVLDEVDRMLDMGFIRDIRSILSAIQATYQGFYFSATLNHEVAEIIESFAHNPVHISVKLGETSDNVEQDVVRYSGSTDKISQLHDLLLDTAKTKVLIFDETQRSVERLSNELIARGFSAEAIHGGKTQAQRQRVLEKFKANKLAILVATDVAARGLDINDISHVINYSLPHSYDDYVHRIGRTGRAGKTGFAYTFIQA